MKAKELQTGKTYNINNNEIFVRENDNKNEWVRVVINGDSRTLSYNISDVEKFLKHESELYQETPINQKINRFRNNYQGQRLV